MSKPWLTLSHVTSLLVNATYTVHRTWLKDSSWRGGSRAASAATGRKGLAVCMCLDSLVNPTTSGRHSTIQPKTLGHDNQAGVVIVRGKGRQGTATQSGSPTCARNIV